MTENPVEKERGEPLLKEHRRPGEEVADGLSFLLASVPG